MIEAAAFFFLLWETPSKNQNEHLW